MYLRVALIVGDNHTPFCGVKNYAHSLAQALAERDIVADVLTPNDWGANSVFEFARQLREENYDIVHLQYPSVGYRGSLFPHVLGLMKVADVSMMTVHEYSALPLAQRISTQLFRGTASRVIFASQYERSLYNRQLLNLGAPQTVIPIGSNVPEAATNGSRDTTVVYFGQIRPRKGIEQFIELAQKSIESQRPFSFHILGSAPAAHQQYMRDLQQNAPDGVRWSIDLEFAQVSEILASSFVAYLPFPDGVSERRGSMLAALTNGLPVVSTIGEATPEEMLPFFLPSTSSDEALSLLDCLVEDPERYARLCTASRIHAARYTWSSIAAQHVLVYREALRLSGREEVIHTTTIITSPARQQTVHRGRVTL
jgi:glycosyltransferase involved in cell wall biosynthesis